MNENKSVELKGEIICRNIGRNALLERFVESRLASWAQRHKDDWISNRIYYLVTFDRRQDEDMGEERVDCRIEIIGRTDVWTAHEIAYRARDAFRKAIDELFPIRESVWAPAPA